MTPAAYGSVPSPSPSRAKAASGLPGEAVLAQIGDTPLLPLDALTRDLPSVKLLGKAEWHNPGGSVKDRTAASIVAAAHRAGKLGPGKILLDSTSGNTGIAYSMLGAALGFPVTLCVPENVSPERKRILQAYGANIIYTDPAEGSDGALKTRANMPSAIPISIFTPISIRTTPTGVPTMKPPPTKSGNKPKGVLRISSPCSAPPEPSSAPRAG
jgi:hypothetical protein